MEIKNTHSRVDQVAKLLSTENISIVRGGQNAFFDLKNRVLNLPNWSNMSDDVNEMLALHEVGHALFTDPVKYVEASKIGETFSWYLNIIEDVRIERKMKLKYPGARKNFIAGYQELIEKDFFGIKSNKLKLNEMNLIDRINFYFKAGRMCGVSFNSKEQEFVDQCEKTETINDVITLTKAVFEYAKALEKEKEESGNEESTDAEKSDSDQDSEQSPTPGNMNSNCDDGEESLADTDSDSRSSSEKTKEKDSNCPSLESKTAKTFEDKLQRLITSNEKFEYLDLDFEHRCKESYKTYIVPFKTILSDVSVKQHTVPITSDMKKFYAESNKFVSYLIKEFEMRKAASAYNRTTIARTGQLDSRKLYAYKLKDDLFRQIALVKNGKKHGVVFLLDWSGSMDSCIVDTLKQILTLTSFCRRTNIPFDVYAFNDNYSSHDYSNYYTEKARIDENDVHNPKGLGSADVSRVHLLNILSSKMSAREYKSMGDILISKTLSYIPGYGMGGTPLNEALMLMLTKVIGKFIKENNTEKNTFILLSDGDGTAIYNTSAGRYKSTYTSGKVTQVITDPITKKQYKFANTGCEQTSTLMQIIKDRYDVNTMHFYVVPDKRNIEPFIRNSGLGGYNVRDTIEKARNSYMSNGVSVIDCMPGRDVTYLIRSNQKMVDASLTIDADMSTSQISDIMTFSMKNYKNSRVVLSNFIKIFS